MKAHVGVSGFSYATWKGKFYPEDTKSEEFLSYYSSKLGSVEVNSSFYAPPSTSMVKGWSAKTSEKFRFSFKAPRLITHILKLGKGSSEAANKLSKTLDLLGPRRGPVLFQLPPFSKFDRDLLDGFLSRTSGIEPKVFEFRHASWLNERTYDLLEDHGTGFCVADTEDMEPTFRVTGGLAYFRLRKDFYDGKAVGQWSDMISKAAASADECYVYLRHDETGENALLAQKLAESLDAR
ncbi:MAG: DUF72 domain-containing protein [Thaumarchaeota archaeon]|nr:DUF72 domain-containing protein [Nitrososphaerota archaeon]